MKQRARRWVIQIYEVLFPSLSQGIVCFPLHTFHGTCDNSDVYHGQHEEKSFIQWNASHIIILRYYFYIVHELIELLLFMVVL